MPARPPRSRALDLGLALLSLALLPLALLPLALCPPPCARAAPTRRTGATLDAPLTLLSLDARTLTAASPDGQTVRARVSRATWFLRGGLPASASDFAPGEAVCLRLSRGASRAALRVCDPETARSLAAWRGRALSGTLRAVSGTAWVIQPPGDGPPVTVCVSARTLYAASGASASAAAFGPGAEVTVRTRGLASGLLSAVQVSDALPAAPEAADAPVRARASLTGTVLDVRPDLGLVTLRDKTGVARPVAVDGRTRVKVGGHLGTLSDVRPGARATARLGPDDDAAGNPLATSLSAR